MLDADLHKARDAMVERQLRGRGIADDGVLETMRRIPRHRFVVEGQWDLAYGDHPLPIGHGQTISQPYMVARMTELCRLQPSDRVLEIGAGSGYQSAVLAAGCCHVYSTEIVSELAQRARGVLDELEIGNVTLEHRDGSKGWAEHGPFDAILVAAGAPAVPQPLADQLVEGGRLVIPVGERRMHVLQRWTRRGTELDREDDTPCRFVDLQGEYGWK